MKIHSGFEITCNSAFYFLNNKHLRCIKFYFKRFITQKQTFFKQNIYTFDISNLQKYTKHTHIIFLLIYSY